MSNLSTCRALLLAFVIVFQLPSAGVAVTQAEIDEAVLHVRWAWNEHGPCTRVTLCATYFDTFGVNISFEDGSVVPFAKVQRLTTSAHDCIANAKSALAGGDRGLAVQWTMASQIHNDSVRNWMRSHPDAVIAALHRVN